MHHLNVLRKHPIRHDILYLGSLVLIALLFLWPAWVQPQGFLYPPDSAFSDLTITHWPKMWFAVRTLRTQGQIPLWLPLILGGTPLVGNPLAAYFYPLNWLFLVLPVTVTFQILFGLDLIAAGVTFYGLIRWSYGRPAFAAFVGAVGYMLTPKLVAHMGAGHVGWCQAFSWLPLALWLLRSAFDHQSGRRAAWCGAVLALIFFADPRVAFYGASVLGLYALYRLVGLLRGEGWAEAGRMAWRLLLVPGLLCAVGAAQILPTVEMMTVTTRGALSLQEAGVDSLPWRYLIGYLLPDYGGYQEWMTYLGWVPLWLAALALWRPRGRPSLWSSLQERWFWAGLAAAALLFALGVHAPLYPLIFRLLPGLGWVRVPSRALLVVCLAVNVLSAAGAEALFGGAWSPRARRWGRLLALSGLLICLGLGIGFGVLLGRNLPLSVLVFSLVGSGAMGVWLWRLRGRGSTARGQVVLALLLLFDLGVMGRSLFVVRPPEEVLSQRDRLAAYLSRTEGRFRVYSPSYSVPHHTGARYGLEQLDGVDPSQVRWLAHYMALAGGYEMAAYSVTVPVFPSGAADWQTALRNADLDPVLLGLMNGRFVVAEFPLSVPGLRLVDQIDGAYLYENERCWPRAFLMTRTERVADWQAAQERLATGFDPAQGALVETGAVLDGPPGWQAARIVSFAPNRIVVAAEAKRASLLVLGEVWYPGWRVTVDGVEQPIERVYGLMRGVYLAPGVHEVVWVYRPPTLWWGIGIALVSLAGLVVCSAWTCGKRRGGEASR